MRILLSLFCLFILQTQNVVLAETEEEEMARIQRQLNNRVFGMEEKPKEPAPAPAAAPKAPAPEPKTATAPDTSSSDSDTSSLPLSSFTSYQLAGLTLGKEEQAVMDSLKKQGYNCNIQQMAMAQSLTGKRMCIYVSMEDPKVAMIGFADGKLRDLETHETYKTSFPEKFFKRAKDKFIAKYGDEASCKDQGKGEICEVFGHGYRILFRTEVRRDKAKIIHRVAKM